MATKRRAFKRSAQRSQKKARVSSKKSGALRSIARSQVYPFRRFHFKIAQGGTDNVPLFGNVTFTLGDVPNHTEFTTLFDQYKIAGIKYRWVLTRNPDYSGTVISNVYNTTYQGSFPRIMWVHDYDDSGVPANLLEMQQYPKMKEVYLTGSNPMTPWYYIRPARSAVEYEALNNSSYRPQWKGFIDCASTTAPHYGIKYGVDGLNTGLQLRLECWYYMVFKNVR